MLASISPGIFGKNPGFPREIRFEGVAQLIRTRYYLHLVTRYPLCIKSSRVFVNFRVEEKSV